MALQTTGAITLANIQTEFGGANPISLSEYYAGGGLVPSGTAGIPTSGLISLNNFYGAASRIPAWILDLTAAQLAYSNSNIVYNPNNGKITVCAKVKNYNYDTFYYAGIIEIDAVGNATNVYLEPLTIVGGITFDSTGNKYLFAANSSSPTTAKSNIIKLNSNNEFQWKKVLSTIRVYPGEAMSIKTDGSHIYTASIDDSSGLTTSRRLNIAKYDFSGNLQFSTTRNVASASSYFEYGSGFSQMAVGSTNFYFATLVRIPSPNANSIVQGRFLKTTGVIQASITARRNGGGFENSTGGVVVSSDNFVYHCSVFDETSTIAFLTLAKLSESANFAGATFIRAIRIIYSGADPTCGSHTLDGSNNIYIGCNFTFNTRSAILIAKYNSSGTLQWQRILSHSSMNLETPRITVDNAGSFIVSSNIFVVKLPVDGSLTGTYSDTRSGYSGQNWTYSVSTFTEDAQTLSTSTSSFSSTATSAPTLDADTSLTVRSESVTKVIRDLN